MKLQTNNMSPKVLKNEAYDFIAGNNRLMADLATVLSVNLLSMPMMLQRKSKRFMELSAISLIAEEMKCEPQDLLIDDIKSTV
jgi:hypothetical protein